MMILTQTDKNPLCWSWSDGIPPKQTVHDAVWGSESWLCPFMLNTHLLLHCIKGNMWTYAVVTGVINYANQYHTRRKCGLDFPKASHWTACKNDYTTTHEELQCFLLANRSHTEVRKAGWEAQKIRDTVAFLLPSWLAKTIVTCEGDFTHSR